MSVNYSELSDDQLREKYKEISKDIAKYNNFQMAKKILMNSLYGAAGNQGFRFYDPRYAEGITLTGQYFIQAVGHAINAYISKLTKTEFDYTFYQDTDSCYVALQHIVERFIIPRIKKEDGSYDVQKVIDAMNSFSDDKITPAINAACDDIAAYTNSLKQLMNFKRESLAGRGVWTSKKRYALNVYDNEGVRYAEPKIKIMGLEIVRSSTPAPVRKMLKEAVNIVLTGSEKDLQEYCEKTKNEFYSLPAEEIAYPRGVQRLDHYSNQTTIYQKGCPIHVRAALMFNHLLKTHGLTNDYDEIRDGDKIKFIMLKTPNTSRENVIAFSEKLPKEFNLHKYVDYDEMWQKAFIAPLENIIGAINWKHKETANLNSLWDD